MRQVTTEELAGPGRTLDAEVVEFRAQFGNTSPLDELVRHGAQQMLQSAIEMEVDDFLAQHAQRRDAAGPPPGDPQRLPSLTGDSYGRRPAGS